MLTPNSLRIEFLASETPLLPDIEILHAQKEFRTNWFLVNPVDHFDVFLLIINFNLSDKKLLPFYSIVASILQNVVTLKNLFDATKAMCRTDGIAISPCTTNTCVCSKKLMLTCLR